MPYIHAITGRIYQDNEIHSVSNYERSYCSKIPENKGVVEDDDWTTIYICDPNGGYLKRVKKDVVYLYANRMR